MKVEDDRRTEKGRGWGTRRRKRRRRGKRKEFKNYRLYKKMKLVFLSV
jgi:hypothetical protein